MRRVTLLALVLMVVALGGCRRWRERRRPRHARRPPAVAFVPPADAGDPPVVMPGLGIGPVSLGTSRAGLVALGFTLTPTAMGDRVAMAGPYRVVFDDASNVRAIEVELRSLPSGARVGDALVPPTASLRDATTVIPGCDAVEVREGGNVARCAGGGLLVKEAGPTRVVSLSVEASGS